MKSVLIITLAIINIGIYAQTWTTSGANAILSSGNAGIGIDPPLEKLHINGSIRGNAVGGAVRINTPTGYLDLGSVNSLYAHFYTDRPKYYFNRPITVDGAISSYNTNDLILQTNGTTRISVLTNNGYTGIGTSTPTSMLHVVQSNNTDWAATVVNNGGSGKGLLVKSASGNATPVLQVEDYSGNNRLMVRSDGYVGVGTTTPTTALDVNGTIRSTTFLKVTNVSYGHGIFADDGVGSTVFSLTRQLSNETRLHSFGFHTFYSGGSTGTEKMRIAADGNVGIGTTNPTSKLQISGGGQTIYFATGTNTSGYALNLGVNDDGINFSNNSSSRGFNFSNINGNLLKITSGGNVGIGTTTPDAKLAVKGTIHAQQINVDLDGAIAPDYVFEPDYKLLSLEEVKSYIDQHKHLPDVPAAKEIEAKGINVTEMNLLLLRKIEELTLHVIELKKENDRQNKIIQELTSNKK